MVQVHIAINFGFQRQLYYQRVILPYLLVIVGIIVYYKETPKPNKLK